MIKIQSSVKRKNSVFSEKILVLVTTKWLVTGMSLPYIPDSSPSLPLPLFNPLMLLLVLGITHSLQVTACFGFYPYHTRRESEAVTASSKTDLSLA